MRFVTGFFHLLTCAKEEHIEQLEVLEKERECESGLALGPEAMGEYWL